MEEFNPEIQIIYEDNHLIVVNKFPSQIVQGDKTGDTPLSDSLKNYLKIKYNKPGNVFLGVAHRLDRPVSGLVIFTKTSKALARMNSLIKDRQIQKSYWAVVGNKPPEETGLLEHYLVKDEKRNKSFVTDQDRKGAKLARLTYTLLSLARTHHLLEIQLETGRHHQIRVQLAQVGCPIKGDVKYGYKRSNSSAFIHLHARQISLKHPVGQKPLEFLADPPKDPLWNYFLNI